MRIRNNNKQIERELALRYYRTNTQRNRIVILAIAMSVFLLYTVFSIIDGKIRSDYLIDVRGMGTLANIALQTGSEEQYKQMKELSYLSDVGVVKKVAAMRSPNNRDVSLMYMDATAFEKLQKPAYTDLKGAYPEKENEIMLPRRTLEAMEIYQPALGMEISYFIDFGNGKQEEHKFYLSGYFVDYVDASVNLPEAYVSELFLKQYHIEMFPSDKIIAAYNQNEDSQLIKARLYSDISMESESQQFFGENPMVMQSVQRVFGSWDIAIICMLLIVLCAFMLIYNVVSMSMGKDIRQYGFLKVLGTTNSQLRKVAFRQNLWSIEIGTLLGSVSGIIFVKIFLDSVLQALFMKGLGKSDVKGVYIDYLLCAIGLVYFTASVAMGIAVQRVIKWNAIDTIKYVEVDSVSYSKKKSSEVSMVKMAWRNITRSKKRLFVSLCSLLLAVILFLGSAVIVAGTNQMNRLKENADFQVGILAGAFRFPEKIPDELNDSTEVFRSEAVSIITNLDGIKRESIDYVEGSYAVIDFSVDQSLEPRRKSLEDTGNGRKLATLQIVSDSYIEKLEKYIKDKDIRIDIEALRNGTGCVLLHYDEMSQILNEQAESVVGMPIHFYSLLAYHPDKIDKRYEQGELSCAGYLDCTDSFFPKLHTTSMGNNINYFIMTQEAFQKLHFPAKIFDISFDVNEEDEIAIHQKIVQLIQNENIKSGNMDTFYENANYLLIESEESEIQTANILLGGLSFILLLIGIMNFSNTLLTNHAVRKKEIEIMQSIGLTKNQLLKLIMIEGLFYWGLLLSGVVTIGNMSIAILGYAVGQKLQYFKFFYPWKQLFFLVGLLFVVNLVLAVKMYVKQHDKKER